LKRLLPIAVVLASALGKEGGTTICENIRENQRLIRISG